jgi:hypothetical protein
MNLRSNTPKARFLRILSVYTALAILTEIVAPTCAWALTGGPSQPEVQSFEPVGTSDMVDLFTGDLNYNIPLLDVDGYPINISYHSGITMDQEASWVGLGWNINPGVINRTMRGIPDDFDGDEIVKEMNIKPNVTVGLSTGLGAEFMGYGGLGYNIGVHYNNYVGIGVEQTFNLSIGGSVSGGKGGASVCAAIGMNSSSEDGLSLQPSVGMSATVGNAENGGTTASLGSSVSLSYNSRAGLKSLTIGVSGSSNKSFANIPNSGQMSSTYNLLAPTYTPAAPFPMENTMVTGNFTLGGEIFGLHGSVNVGGYLTVQKLATKMLTNPAYGYMNSGHGQRNPRAIHDFNREKEGTFFRNSPNLAVTNYTYDIFSVSGQGTSGSYRPFRSDRGWISDPANYSKSDGYSLGVELGGGNLVHVGADFIESSSYSSTGAWINGNWAVPYLQFKNSTDDPLYEPYYFKEANEKAVDNDPDFITNQGNDEARAVALNQIVEFSTVADANLVGSSGTNSLQTANYRKKREARNQSISILNRYEVDKQLGLQEIENLHDNGLGKLNHHIAEITSLNKDGSRYVYGIAAYNSSQQEVSFATGSTLEENGTDCTPDRYGMVTYSSNDNSLQNKRGLDNYYSNTKMPAYAHSYLLTAILSPDYVDSENGKVGAVSLKGPSNGDMGNYTKFEYEKISDYKWRVPYESMKANHSEGFRCLKYDDKGNYIYGTKDIYFLNKVESKNYVAVFQTETRSDALGAAGRDGGPNTNLSQGSRLLRKISLYSKMDYYRTGSGIPAPIPIKEVHFEYDYSLCQKVHNNINTVAGQKGKLTLKKIYFTYQNSKKGRFSPYTFKYEKKVVENVVVINNPEYDIKGYDRWGNYKPNPIELGSAYQPAYQPGSQTSNELSNGEYPYAEQSEEKANLHAQAWTLQEIGLPSGGVIKLGLESDDYSSVQNKQAGQMFKFVGIDSDGQGTAQSGYTTVDVNVGRIYDTQSIRLMIQLDESVTEAEFKDKYMRDLGSTGNLYYRFLMKMRNDKYEYVSGYIPPSGIERCGVYGGQGNVAWIDIFPVFINDTDGAKVSPMTKAATQFGRLNLSKVVWATQNIDVNENSSLGTDLLTALIESDFFKNIKDSRKGSNNALYKRHDVGHEAITNKSWVRLYNGNGKKKGGGLRVKSITISDSWNDMAVNPNGTGSEMESEYGQEYTYTLEDGVSSGVASYEPLIGGDENPWRSPINFGYARKWVPDDLMYLEEPFGECFFPSPSVGYSKVTVVCIHNAPSEHPTGYVEHEFYTAKDFPTIAVRTDVQTIEEVDNPMGIRKLLKINARDYLNASQGYLVEVNDMHGKPKKITTYAYSEKTNITSCIEYKYKVEKDNTSHLSNIAKVIDNKGNVSDKQIGFFSDFISDFNEQKTSSESGGAETNLDVVLYGIYPIPQPMVKPVYTSDGTQFHSAVVTKVVQRFGLLEETIVTDSKSVVSTKNLAYDAETGNVLVTETTTDFSKDHVYSLTFPSFWHYEGMGPAYRNLGHQRKLNFEQPIGNGPVTGIAFVNNATAYYNEGDELALYGGSEPSLAWITEVTPYSIKLVNWAGTPIDFSKSGGSKVIRSGRRNQQDLAMATITSLSNPLDPSLTISSNVYGNVLQASAIEYSNSWRTFCNCFVNGAEFTNQLNTLNPFILGTKGFWKVKRSFAHLTGRKQSNYNNNTNIRKDGVMTSFSPYYRYNGSKWEVDGHDWTFASEITEFSPFGNEIENRDATGIYSSSIYGYNQSLPLSVASNAHYTQIAFDNFEDYDFSSCTDNHFKFKNDANSTILATNLDIRKTEGHTGKRSALVHANTQVKITKALDRCPLIECDLNLSTSSSDEVGSTYQTVSISNGKAPFQINYTIVSGNPTIDLIANGKDLRIDGVGPYVVIVETMDANGCYMSTQVIH